MTRRLIVGALGITALIAVPRIALAAQQPTTHTVSQKHSPSTVSVPEDTRTLLSERRALHASRSMARPAPKPASRVSRPKPKPKPKPVHHVTVQQVVHVSVPTSAVKLYALHLVGSMTQFSCVDSIFTRESHWNPLARNRSSGAFGIPQRMGAPPGWTDPYVQVKWGIGYMTSKYGSPCGAWSFWQGHHWY